MKKKELYEAPSVETYDLILENNVLETGSPTRGTAGQNETYNDIQGTGSDGLL